jgi:predicted ATPase
MSQLIRMEFTVDELLEIEEAMQAHEASDPKYQAAVDSVDLKVGLALKLPWAVQKAQNAQVKP